MDLILCTQKVTRLVQVAASDESYCVRKDGCQKRGAGDGAGVGVSFFIIIILFYFIFLFSTSQVICGSNKD